MNRFDYVKYDEQIAESQADYKEAFIHLDSMIEHLKPGRAKALAITKLEESYMWIGKALRDEQVERNGSAELQEQRTDS